MITSLTRGENYIFKRNLQDSGGTATPLSSYALLRVELIQFGTVLATYVYGTNNQLRQGDSATQAELELTKTVSAALRTGGKLEAKWTLEVTEPEFAVDGVQADVITETLIQNVI